MSKQRNLPQYGNWVPIALIRKTFLAAAVFAFAAAARFLAPPSVFGGNIILALGLMSALSLVCAAYFLEARHLLSDEGGGVQQAVTRRLLEQIEALPDGAKLLDIGCGSGTLAIQLAKMFPDAQVTGADSWSSAWEYSRAQCERNAALEGVADRTDFIRASASRLPFDDESFDLVVSNMTFHEVRDIPDKRLAVREALRVLKKDGTFVFQDLFLLGRYFGTPEQLTAALRKWDVGEVHFIAHQKNRIPFLLRLPFMLGALGILYGTK